MAGGRAGRKPVPGPEYVTNLTTTTGTRWVCVGNVAQPTMTVYSPKGTNTGVAVVVFPGGGYNVLAMDLEGTEVCDWLTTRGIMASSNRKHRRHWKMGRERWGCCVFTRPNGILGFNADLASCNSRRRTGSRSRRVPAKNG